MERVDLAAERAGQADLVDGVAPELVHEQPDAGVQGGLGELDRPDVVLGDDDPRPAVGRLVEDVAERPAVGDDPRRPRRERAVDDAVGGDDAGEVQLGDDLDDPGAADAGDAGAGGRRPRRRSSGSSDQASTPMTRNRGSSVVAVDAHALDGAGRGALARR